jgi:hypothetical protein
MGNLDELKAAAEKAAANETEAKEAFTSARIEREDAVASYNAALAAEAGIVLGETIVEAYRYGWDREADNRTRVVITQGGCLRLGMIVGRPVTSQNRLHKGRKPVAVSLDNLASDYRGKLEAGDE